MSNVTVDPDGTFQLPQRQIPVPAHLSAGARAALQAPRQPARIYPPLADIQGWREMVERLDAALLPRLQAVTFEADAERLTVASQPVYKVTPRGTNLLNRRQVILELHGGALLYCGGAIVEPLAKSAALRTGRAVYSLDYRMVPDHPYPAALDDCLGLYRYLLEHHAAQDIVIYGTSAGGNLAAATMLRARDEGLPLPAGVVLLTPEVDLTESGDTFHTLDGLDSVLTSTLMPINHLYAAGANLADPYLSPLFGDFTRGFPPTFLQSGTRDLLLSNTVRLHRRLRAAQVRAELHVWDAMPHGGFGGADEDRELTVELRHFLDALT